MTPSIPYGWQPIGTQLAIRSAKDHVCNLLGFLSRMGKLKVWSTRSTINSDFVIECIDEIAQKIQKPTVIVLDNAPWHRAQKVRIMEQRWNQKGLYLFFLPIYSPHLNLIEILWRKMKYEWLKPEDYLSPSNLRSAIEQIITSYDSTFFIRHSNGLFQ